MAPSSLRLRFPGTHLLTHLPGPTPRPLLRPRSCPVRRGYPPALRHLEKLAGRPLRGARTIDVGAGKGISTRLLHDRGARVTAVEPGACMAEELHQALPYVPTTRGDGNQLPIATASAGLITYARPWHWTDRNRATPEALRPGGALALWRNVSDHCVPWIAEQDARLRRFIGADEGAHGSPVRSRHLPSELSFVHRTVPWTRRMSLDTHLANLGSHSASSSSVRNPRTDSSTRSAAGWRSASRTARSRRVTWPT
ncbi:class I SAM-dependent methyltransferase [Streptomyces sp. NPDC051286]|uniref:class I SAM-dependent methyltransferase n=1 Tax=Streptomyces sp. NPDC051286 TaxID=3365647 RepID=UPI0037AC0C33